MATVTRRVCVCPRVRSQSNCQSIAHSSVVNVDVGTFWQSIVELRTEIQYVSICIVHLRCDVMWECFWPFLNGRWSSWNITLHVAICINSNKMIEQREPTTNIRFIDDIAQIVSVNANIIFPIENRKWRRRRRCEGAKLIWWGIFGLVIRSISFFRFIFR